MNQKQARRVLGVLLGLIGLIIGLCPYPSDTIERTTFIKGWGIAFGISVGISIIFYVIVFSSLFAAIV